MKINLLLINTLILSVFIASNGCQSNTKLSRKNIIPYSTNIDNKVKYRLFHKGKTAQFFIQTYAQHYHITLKAYTDFKAKTIIYKSSKIIKAHPNTIQTIDLPTKTPTTYILELLVVNQLDKSTFSDIIVVDKTKTSEQTILVQDATKAPLLSKKTIQNQVVRFSSANKSDSIFYIKYINNNFKSALPPFARSSTIFNLRKRAKRMYRVKSDDIFTLDKQGLYLVQTDSLSKEGLFINCVDENFPRITELKELANCLRYITKKEEYQNITNPNLDTKLELDKFWLSRAGNKNKARLLIRLYYNRIQLANEYFSTYKKGWQTDRGMIYTVFGVPNRIQKSGNTEYWFYRRTPSRDMVEFFFDKKNSQYILRRSPMLELSWRSEIYGWRTGSVLK